jgi:hypothetical protein
MSGVYIEGNVHIKYSFVACDLKEFLCIVDNEGSCNIGQSLFQFRILSL